MSKIVKRVASKSDLEKNVEDRMTEGFKIQSQTGQQAVLVRRTLGSVFWHVVFFIFTLGTLTIPYLLYSYFLKKEELILKVGDA